MNKTDASNPSEAMKLFDEARFSHVIVFDHDTRMWSGYRYVAPTRLKKKPRKKRAK